MARSKTVDMTSEVCINYAKGMAPFMRDVLKTLALEPGFQWVNGHGLKDHGGHGGHGLHSQLTIGLDGQRLKFRELASVPRPVSFVHGPTHASRHGSRPQYDDLPCSPDTAVNYECLRSYFPDAKKIDFGTVSVPLGLPDRGSAREDLTQSKYLWAHTPSDWTGYAGCVAPAPRDPAQNCCAAKGW